VVLFLNQGGTEGVLVKIRVMLMATLVFTLYKILMMKHLTPEEEEAGESLLILVV
jgi:hypothetical protein